MCLRVPIEGGSGMSNDGLKQRMLDLIDSFQRGEVTPGCFERQFNFYVEGLDRVTLSTWHLARSLSGRLVRAHFWEGETEFGTPEEAAFVVDEIRRFVSQLPATMS